MYTIIQLLNKADTQANGGDNCFYLNHSAMNTKSFGSADMMWTTESKAKAKQMLKMVKAQHQGGRKRFAVEEV